MAKAIKFKKFKRFDAHKAEAGVPHAIRDEVGNYYGTFITSLFDPHNKFIQRESKRYYEKFGTSPENQGDKASLFAFVQICVHGWEGVEEEDGKAVPFSKEAAIAKLFCSELAMRATITAVQLHGGYGYTKDYPVERYMRDAKIC